MNILEARYMAASLRADLPTIDLHGMRLLSVAEQQLETELYSFFQKKEGACRVVHGIGEGSMKAMVHRVLQKNPLVQDFGLSEDGGSTVVLFDTL